MHEFNRLIAGKVIRTWEFGDEADYQRNKDLIPPHEHRRYDMIYNYKDALENVDVADRAASPPQAAPAAETLTPATTPPATAPGTSLGAGAKNGAASPQAAPAAETFTAEATPPTTVLEASLESATGVKDAVNFVAGNAADKPAPAGSGTSFFQAKPLAADIAAAKTITTPVTFHVSVPAHLPTPESILARGLPSFHTAPPQKSPIAPEHLARIKAVPVFFGVKCLSGCQKGVVNYHYFLPPLSGVSLDCFHGGGFLGNEPLLPVSKNAGKGVSRDDWLYIDMGFIWAELKRSLAAEYSGSIFDIGLASGGWVWVKTDWNWQMPRPETKLIELISLFLDTGPVEGTPLIMTPIIEDEYHLEVDIPPSDDQVNYTGPNPQVLESTAPNTSPLQGYCRVGNAYMLMEESEDQENNQVKKGTEDYNHGALKILEKMPYLLDLLDKAPGAVSKELELRSSDEGIVPCGAIGAEATKNLGQNVSNSKLQGCWLPTGNASMLMGGSKEELEWIVNVLRMKFGNK